jgi:hypothetical protein
MLEVFHIKYSIHLFNQDNRICAKFIVSLLTEPAKVQNRNMEQNGSHQRLPLSKVPQSIRVHAEISSKHYLVTSFVHFPLTLAPNLPLPLATFDG